jgi:hypothetical protein
VVSRVVLMVLSLVRVRAVTLCITALLSDPTRCYRFLNLKRRGSQPQASCCLNIPLSTHQTNRDAWSQSKHNQAYAVLRNVKERLQDVCLEES